MNKNVFPAFVLSILLFCSLVSAQDITVSKDSIQIYNNPIMSFADAVIFTTSHTSSPVRLDSAIIAVSEIDTVGFSSYISQNKLEVGWRTNALFIPSFFWTMDSTGPNTYRMVKEYFDPSSAEPLVFSGNDTTSQIISLEIGLFLYGQTRPEYPRYIRGAMSLFFSNGQVIELKLRSQDLRTGVKRPLRQAGVRTSAVSYRCLANGRMVPAGNKAVVPKNRISSVKAFGKR